MNNFLTLVGNLTRDPELRYTPGGVAVAQFGLAVNRFVPKADTNQPQETDFFDVTAWRELGENCAESLSVGSRVIVTGRLQQDRWENDGGEKRSKIYIMADEIGPSLRWATVSIMKVERSSPDGQP